MSSCQQARIVGLLHAALQRQRRIKRAFGDLHLQQRGVDIVHRGGHAGCVAVANPDRRRQSAAAKTGRPENPAPACRARRRSPAGRSQREACRLASAVSTCERPGAKPRFRLRHVGARHLADIEAVARLAQLLLQHLDVAAAADRGSPRRAAGSCRRSRPRAARSARSRRKVSRAAGTWLSACRVRLAV